MSHKHNVSHNVCYDYSTLRWKVQPSDFVRFWDRDGSCVRVGEIILLSRDLMHLKCLKDGRIFVISLYVLSEWCVKPIDTIRRLPNGVFKQGDRVCLDGELNLPDEKYIIEKFDNGRVKVHYFVKGRSVGWYFVRESEILKYMEVA